MFQSKSAPTCMVCVIVIFFALAGAAAADTVKMPNPETSTTSWSVAASYSRLFGDTNYELNALSPDPRNTDELVPIRSELAFPLDMTLLGVVVSWSPGEAATGRWNLAAEFRTNVSDPSDPATDGDWIDNTQISYTESPATMDFYGGALEVAYGLQPGPRPSWSLLLRVDYERIEQHLVGYEGWRRSLFSDQIFYVAGTAPVLDYRVTHLTPQLGARGRLGISTHLEATLQATAGLALSWDKDDHLLRGRISEGDGVGFGARGRLAIDLLPGFMPWRWLTVGVTGDIFYHHAEGDVTQTWYRNEDQPAGTVIADIPFVIETLQYQVGLRVGVAF